MKAEDLSMMFRVTHNVIHRNLKGVDQAKSLMTDGHSPNCINWIVGHLLATRNAVHSMLDLPVPDWDNREFYRGDFDVAGVSEISDLVANLKESHKTVVEALGKFDENWYNEISANQDFGLDRTRGQVLAFFQFHESYHAGQLGILRRAAGLDGVIGKR